MTAPMPHITNIIFKLRFLVLDEGLIRIIVTFTLMLVLNVLFVIICHKAVSHHVFSMTFPRFHLHVAREILV